MPSFEELLKERKKRKKEKTGFDKLIYDREQSKIADKISKTDLSDIYSAISGNGYIESDTLNTYKSRISDYKSALSQFDFGGDEDKKNAYLADIGKLSGAVNTFSDYMSSFKDKDEYTRAYNTVKYKNYSYDDIQKVITARQHRSTNDEETAKEVEWLKNYALTKEYDSISDYDLAIDQAEKKLKELYATGQKWRGAADVHGGKDLHKDLDEEIKKYENIKDSLSAGKNLKLREEEYKSRMSVKENPDYVEKGYNTDFGNPSRQEITDNETRANATMWHQDNDGVTYNAFGERVGTTEEEKAAYSAKYSKTEIPDRLGLYFSTIEDETANDAWESAIAGRDGEWENLMLEGANNNWDLLKPDEIAVYYYYLNHGEKKNADAFLDSMSTELGRRADTELREGLEDAEWYEKLFLNIASVPANVYGGVVGFAEDAHKTVLGEEINPYSAAHRATNFASAVREATSQDIEKDAGAFLANTYQAGMSMADSVLGSTTLGSGYTVTMGMGAATQKAKELYEQGASKTDIAWGGITSGAIEFITEKLSYDFIVNNVWEKAGTLEGKERVLQIIKGVFASAANEGIEEVNADLLNMAADAIIQGYNSADERKIKDYIVQQGLTEEEARKKVAAENAVQTFWSFYGGFISGGGHAVIGLGINAAKDSINTRQAITDIGSDIIDAQNVDRLIANAESLEDTKDTAKTKKIASEIKNTDVESLSEREKTAFEHKVGKLFDEVNKAQIKQYAGANRTAFKSAIKEELDSKGIENSKEVAEIVTKGYFETLGGEDKKQFDRVGGEDIINSVLNSNEFYDKVKANTDAVESSNVRGIQNTVALTEKAKASISGSGKTVQISTGKDVTIKEISSIKDGKMTFTLDDGTKVSSEDIQYANNDEAFLYEAVKSMKVNAATGNAIVNGFDSSSTLSARSYMAGMEEGYRYGEINMPLTSVATDTFFEDLSESQKMLAYKLGQIDAAASAKAAQERLNKAKTAKVSKKGTVHLDADESNLTDRQRASLEAIGNIVSNVTNNDVYIYESVVKDGKRVFSKDIAGHKAGEKAPNGFYDQRTGSIYIDLNAGNNGEGIMLWTAAHELTHFIRQWSPAKFKALADFLMKEYGNKGVNVQELIRDKQYRARKNGRTISYDTAYEEVVADSMQTMFTDTNLSEKLARLKNTDKSLWQKIKDGIADLFNRIKSLYQGLDPQTREGKLVREMKDSLEKLSDMFAEAIVDAGENFGKTSQKNNASEGVKFDVRNDTEYDKPITVNEETNVVDLTEESELKERIGSVRGAEKYKIIQKYIFEKLGTQITFSDGTTAIIDNRDALHIANKSADKKTTEISAVDELVKNAVVYAEDDSPVHIKFNYFLYYICSVKYAGETFPIYLNLGRGKNDGKLHLYDITHKIKDTARRINGVERLREFRSANGIFDSNSITTSEKSQEVKERLLSDRNTSATDSRTLLSDALASVASNEIEKSKIEEYQSKIDTMNAEQAKLANLRAEIKELSFSKGKRDMAKLRELRAEATKIANRISIYDKQLLSLEATKPLQRILEREKAKAVKKAKAEGKEALKAYKESATRKQQEIINKYNMRIAERKKTELRNKIKKTHHDLDQMLRNPTDNNYIPRDLISAALDTLEAIDIRNGKDNMTQSALDALYTEYNELKNNDDYDYSSEYDKGLSEEILELKKLMKGTNIYDKYSIPFDTLQRIEEIAREIYGTIKDAKRQVGEAEGITIRESGMRIINEQDALTRERKGVKGIVNKADDATSLFYLNSLRAVLKMSNYNENAELYKLFDALNRGQQKGFDWQMMVNKKLDALVKTKEDAKAYDDAQNKVIDYGFAKMTKMQAMQLLMTIEREMAIGTNHIDVGGISITDSKYGDNTKKARVNARMYQGKASSMYTELQFAFENDKWAQRYMNTAREILNVDSKSAINETSLILKHRLLAAGESYIPFVTNDSFTVREIEGLVYDATIAGRGNFKRVQKGAQNNLYIEGLDKVLSRSIKTTADYYGLAVPIRNLNKALNVKNDIDGVSVRKSIEGNWQAQGIKLIEQTLTDIQSPRKNDRLALLDAFRSAFITSTLNGNISVAIKQAASLDTAFAVLDYRPSAIAWAQFASTVKNYNSIINEIDEHTSEHWRRRIGLSTDEVASMTQNTGLLGKLNKKLPTALNGMKWIQMIDCWTTASFWNMAKQDIEKHNPNLEVGSQEYWNKVTDLYNRTIEETQPMYDTLHRSEMQKNGKANAILMFKTQPLQNTGVLYEATQGYAAAKKSGDNELIQQRKRKLVKAVTSQTRSAITFACMTALAAALKGKMKRYKDDDDTLTFLSLFKQIGIDVGGTMFGLVVPILGSEAYSYIESAIEGNGYSSDLVTDPTVDALNTLISTIQKVLTDPSISSVSAMLRRLGDLTGYPVSNYYNIGKGIWLNAKDIVNGDFGQFVAGDIETSSSSNYAKQYIKYSMIDRAKSEKVYDKWLEEKKADIIAEREKEGKNALSADEVEKKAKSSIKASCTSQFRKKYIAAYKSNDKDKLAEIRKQMNATGLYGSVDDIIKTCNGWVKDYE